MVAAEREVAGGSGVTVKVRQLAGVYTDPGHIMVYPTTREVRQQFAVCFHALPVDGQPHLDHDETCEAAWFDPRRITELPVHPSMWVRITDALDGDLTSRAPCPADRAVRPVTVDNRSTDNGGPRAGAHKSAVSADSLARRDFHYARPVVRQLNFGA